MGLPWSASVHVELQCPAATVSHQSTHGQHRLLKTWPPLHQTRMMVCSSLTWPARHPTERCGTASQAVCAAPVGFVFADAVKTSLHMC